MSEILGIKLGVTQQVKRQAKRARCARTLSVEVIRVVTNVMPSSGEGVRDGAFG